MELESPKQHNPSDRAAKCHPIVFACDEHYAMPLAAALRSLVETNRSAWPLDIHLLSGTFSEKNLKSVFDSLPNGAATIRRVEVDLRLFAEFSNSLPYCSKTTYARLLIPQLFPDSVSRVLYLDSDLLVLGKLAPLWQMDLDGAVVGAVLDDWLDALIKCGDPRAKDIPRVKDYFNAGVLLIDLDRWREESISERTLDYLKRRHHAYYADQDALNFACDGRWKILDRRWNYQDHRRVRIADIPQEQMPEIVHFVTEKKPWDTHIVSLNADLFDAFRNRTCFARTPCERVRDWFRGTCIRIKADLKHYAFVRRLLKNFKVKR